MEDRAVGSSEQRVSNLGLGTMTWGRKVDMDTADHLIRDFVNAGGSLIDTAPAYGHGAAEKMIGRSIRKGLSRDSVVLMTKAGFSIRGTESIVDTSGRALLADLQGSLQRLRTDYIDVWQIHAWGDAPLEESLAAMDFAVSRGMVRNAGLANFVGWQTGCAAMWQKADPLRSPIISTQVEYSLLARRAEVEIIPAARHLGLGLFPWSPLGRGVLSGQYRNGIPRTSRAASDHFNWFVKPYLQGCSRGVVEAVVRAAEGLELTPVQVALLWVRDAPGVTAPLLGARTRDQLAELLAISDEVLPLPIAEALDDVSGGQRLERR